MAMVSPKVHIPEKLAPEHIRMCIFFITLKRPNSWTLKNSNLPSTFAPTVQIYFRHAFLIFDLNEKKQQSESSNTIYDDEKLRRNKKNNKNEKKIFNFFCQFPINLRGELCRWWYLIFFLFFFRFYFMSIIFFLCSDLNCELKEKEINKKKQSSIQHTRKTYGKSKLRNVEQGRHNEQIWNE